MPAGSPTTSVTAATRNHKGFTLLEVLVAVIVAGIILVTVYGSFSRTMNTKAHAEQRAELWATGRDAVMRIADDLESAVPPYLGNQVLFQGKTDAAGAYLYFVNVNRGAYGATRVLPGRTLVVYEIVPGTQPGLLTVRRFQRPFSAAVAEANDQEVPDEPEYRMTGYNLLSCERFEGQVDIPGSCTRVRSLRFRFYDLVDGQWREAWDSTDPTMLPSRMPYAVEISLVLADERGQEQEFSTIVDLPLAISQPTPRVGA